MHLTPNAINFLKRFEGKKIVFTNGCFDILHRGHISYLNEARQLGDALIIGLNSDASVSRLKGPSRPINKEMDRKFVLENLRCVDCVEIFTEETPLELIKLIKPQVLVKGGDWTPDKIVGSKEVIAWGGKVLSLPFVDGFSTTNIVNKILDQ
jgi:rfaE bifunctional protein nucleotidyltransferase chain/domain